MFRILVIDDDEDQVTVLQELLVHVGYQTDAAKSVKEAVQRVRANPPDLMLCDWYMRDGTAGDIIDQLPGIKIIVMTANSEHDITPAYMSRITGNILLKPHSIDQLIVMIQNALEK